MIVRLTVSTTLIGLIFAVSGRGQTLDDELTAKLIVSGNVVTRQDAILMKTAPGSTAATATWMENFPVPEDSALEIAVKIDPVTDDESGGYADAGLSFGMASPDSDPNRYASDHGKVYVELMEHGNTARFTITLDGRCISFWNKMRSEHGFPNVISRHSGFYDLKIVAIPRGEETALRFFVDHTDRPLKLYDYETKQFVLEWRLSRKLTETNYIGLYARHPGKSDDTISEFRDLTVRRISIEEAERWMPSDEFVMANLNYGHPAMAEVKGARDAGDMEAAKAELVKYFRSRETPKGPAYDLEMARAIAHGKEANWKEVADNACEGIYADMAWYLDFSDYKNDDGTIRWEMDTGFLTRFYHWVCMAYAYERTRDEKYPARIAWEVRDYSAREPYVRYNNPHLGGQIHTMDGSVIAEHILWTGNIGRRLELTWWQTFEAIRKAPGFSQDGMFAFLDSVIRQCRLLTNHTVFLPWDDSGMHGAMALAKSAMLFPMADEAPQWSEIGWDRINYVVDEQFHPDGSHVSLSTGYNWATIRGIEHFYDYMIQSKAEVPAAMKQRVQNMYFHPLALTRPDFGNIDLNDGGWSPIDNPVTKALQWFPGRKDYLFFETRGKQGIPPDPVSRYFPNAGQYVMRTGWGPGQQYLFFGAGPWGASHGKHDALSIYTAFGNELLIRNAGRGAYSGVGNTIHAGQSLSFNTLSPDWAQQNAIPHHKAEMAIGFNPPKRRWISNENFDYGEGAYEYGWHKPGEHIPGKHVRQIVFVKGDHPQLDGYYIVFDTVEPETDREYTWRHPWQLHPGNVRIMARDKSTLAQNNYAAVRIIPVDPEDDMAAEIIQGQERPALLGWRVHGESARSWPVPTYAWQASDVFTRAWIIMMQDAARRWPVQSVEVVHREKPGECRFRVKRMDGGVDLVNRRFPGAEPTSIAGEEIQGDVSVVCLDAVGAVKARLDVTDGADSVAKSRGVAPVRAKPNISERFASSGAVAASTGAPLVINGSFEHPAVAAERGSFESWDFQSTAGTGTWPVERAASRGTYYGKQVAVIHAGGFIGQILRNEHGAPIALTPDLQLRVRFNNLRHDTLHQINLGVYLCAGEKDGGNIADAHSFTAADNQAGKEVALDFTIYSAERLSTYLPEGWERIPIYLKLVGFAGRTVIDRVQVGIVQPDGTVMCGNDSPGPCGEAQDTSTVQAGNR